MFNKDSKTNTKNLFDFIIKGIEDGTIEPKIQAKCVCVDAKTVTPEMAGQEHTVWSHNKVEKVLTLQEGMILITTLDSYGNVVVDEGGHDNTYDIKAEKFAKKYPRKINGHYAQDGTPMITVKIPQEVIPEEGITIVPPNWGGYEGTLMKGGIIMLPLDPNLSKEQQIDVWKTLGAEKLDWYPNNEPQTYADCNRQGVFKDEKLREIFNVQEKEESKNSDSCDIKE